MPISTKEWREERATTVANAKKVVERCKAENRDLTDAEVSTVEAALARVKELDARLKGRETVNSVLSLGSADDDPDHSNSLFSEAAKTGIVQAVKSRTMFRAEVDRKALTSGTLLPTQGTGVAPGLHPNLFPIASLFPNEPASGPTVRYYRMDGATADVVAEAALKPDSGVAITAVDVALSKIATLATFSDEMVEDANYLIGFLARELTNAVIVRENAAILATFAATSGVLTATGVAATVVDLVADAISGQEAISGNTPSAIIAHPNTVATIRKAKSGDGAFHVDPLSSSPSMLHGVRLVSTPATAAGTVWVVGGWGTVVYRRGPISVEIGYNDTNWASNTRTMRCEQRMATAVLRGNSLTQITLT